MKTPRSTAVRPRLTYKQEPLSDQRFHDLVNAMGAFFASVEKDTAAQKVAAIAEIENLMRQHGLSVDDIA
ncbi:hypothetical protein [Hydrogenophaga sp.]|uniref:hypothetical protein n=1 Tax=Hydrogenophaga sp. TaxID=1904254 RepID=UPI002636E6B1|nr:hypothetical protein [Hydrogenophaga sp.]